MFDKIKILYKLIKLYPLIKKVLKAIKETFKGDKKMAGKNFFTSKKVQVFLVGVVGLFLTNIVGLEPETVETKAHPYLSPEALAQADEFVMSLNLDSGSGAAPMLVGVNLSVGQPTRKWPTEKYRELLDRISRARKERVRLILFTAPDERQLAEELLENAPDSVTQLPPGLTLVEASAIIARLDLMISPDTSIIHIARAFDLPVVGLYTRAMINFRQWHPFEFVHGTVVSNDDNGLRDIAVDEVYAKFNEIADSAHLTSKEAS